MRQLKFRVWDNYGGFFLSSKGPEYAEQPNYFYNLGTPYNLSEVLNNTERFVVQQFTGLKDKNGKEIFEGDIIEYYIPWNEETVTRQVVYDETFLQFMSYDLNRRGVFLYEVFEIKKLKVVGNIYENPELLK